MNQYELAEANCMRLVRECAGLGPGLVLYPAIVADRNGADAADLLAVCCKKVCDKDAFQYGVESDEDAAEVIGKFERHTVFGLTEGSLSHTTGVAKLLAAGGRYLSLPACSIQSLARPAMSVDFRAIEPVASKLATILDAADHLAIWSYVGTSISLDLRGRTANTAPGFCSGPGTLASPPNAEVNIAPVEGNTQGKVAINGRILASDIGIMDDPLFLDFVNGKLWSPYGEKAETWCELTQDFELTVGEIGFGLNPLAKLDGGSMEAEGVLGSIHVGIGSNAVLGGMIPAGPHLDHVMLDCSAAADGKLFLKKGVLCLEGDMK